MSVGECFNPLFQGNCKRRRSIGHHLLWPGNEYKTPLEKAFRVLPENILQICECAEKELHEYPPPAHPSVKEMCMALTVAFDYDVQ